MQKFDWLKTNLIVYRYTKLPMSVNNLLFILINFNITEIVTLKCNIEFNSRKKLNKQGTQFPLHKI